MKTNYTRTELIKLCEDAIVPESKWVSDSTEYVQRQVGNCWVLLKAGCKFKVLTDPDCEFPTNDKQVVIRINSKGFRNFEAGNGAKNRFVLPTRQILNTVEDDWHYEVPAYVD